MLVPAFRPRGERAAPGSPGGGDTSSRGGRSPGVSGRAPAVRRGWRTRSCVRRHCQPARCPRSQATSSSVAARPEGGRTVSRSAERHAAGFRRRRPGPDRSETRGTGASLPVPGGPVLRLATDPGCRAGRAAHVCASLEGPRAATRASRRWVEARTVVRRSRSAAGRAPSGEPGRPRSACEAADVLGGPSRRSRSPGEEGDRSRRARGRAEDGVQRLAAVVARTAFGRARGSRPSRRHRPACGRALRGTSSREEPGGTAIVAPARGIRGPDSDSGSPRARTSPVATPAVGTCGGQPVARERSGRPLGLMPGTATAPRGTGGIHRGPVDAGPRGGSTAAGEGAAGWIGGMLDSRADPVDRRGAGHLPQHHGAVGRRLPGRRAGPPQARYSPSAPAPQSATRRTSRCSRAGRPRHRARRCDGAAGRPRAPGQVLAPRTGTPERGPADQRTHPPGRRPERARCRGRQRRRARDRPGGRRRLHRAQRHGAAAARAGAVATVGGRRTSARGEPVDRATGRAVEHVEEGGHAPAGFPVRPGRPACAPRGSARCSCRLPGSRVRDWGRCRGQGES